MNCSLEMADHATHLKAVLVALAASAIVISIAMNAHIANSDTSADRPHFETPGVVPNAPKMPPTIIMTLVLV